MHGRTQVQFENLQHHSNGGKDIQIKALREPETNVYCVTGQRRCEMEVKAGYRNGDNTTLYMQL